MKPYTAWECQFIAIKIEDLETISEALKRLHEKQCERELTKAELTKYNRLRKEAADTAKVMGLHLYLQTDPRGCALWLGDETMNETNYNTFVPMYKGGRK